MENFNDKPLFDVIEDARDFSLEDLSSYVNPNLFDVSVEDYDNNARPYYAPLGAEYVNPVYVKRNQPYVY